MENIAVLIPCYNEELTIEKVIKKYNINTIFFSSTYKEKVLEIIKNNNISNNIIKKDNLKK